ncbi:MAG TPA: hypothetical protein VGS14_10995 [Actinomycetes bacterium]|nr:hypothetical protein [Actinomycetes bacterium]
MGKATMVWRPAGWQSRCVVCRIPFKGPGDRCHHHRETLRQRRRRKPR